MIRSSARPALALAALVAAGGWAGAQQPGPDLLTVPPFRGTAHPRLDELRRAHPPLILEDSTREPDLTPPRDPVLTLPITLAGTVRASDREGRGPVGRIRDLFPALRACWTPPAGAAGRETTIRVAFRRDGRVLGPPRITYAGPGAPGREGERLRASIHAALDACSPLAFTPSFGQAIAGRPVAIRFVDDRGR